MSMPDPQTVTISAVTTPLPRVSVTKDGSVYQSGDGTIRLTFSHQYGKGRARRMVRIDTSKISDDMFRDDVNVALKTSCHVVFDVPDTGYTPAEILALWTGFKTQLTASSDAIITKLLGGES